MTLSQERTVRTSDGLEAKLSVALEEYYDALEEAGETVTEDDRLGITLAHGADRTLVAAQVDVRRVARCAGGPPWAPPCWATSTSR